MIEIIKIKVEAEWKKSDKRDEYWGGYNIPHHPTGYPQINGGFGTPDFSKWTIQDIKNAVLRQYSSWFPDKKLEINVKVIQDDRVKESLESFF